MAPKIATRNVSISFHLLRKILRTWLQMMIIFMIIYSLYLTKLSRKVSDAPNKKETWRSENRLQSRKESNLQPGIHKAHTAEDVLYLKCLGLPDKPFKSYRHLICITYNEENQQLLIFWRQEQVNCHST